MRSKANLWKCSGAIISNSLVVLTDELSSGGRGERRNAEIVSSSHKDWFKFNCQNYCYVLSPPHPWMRNEINIERVSHKFPLGVINQIEIRPNVSTRCQLSTSHCRSSLNDPSRKNPIIRGRLNLVASRPPNGLLCMFSELAAPIINPPFTAAYMSSDSRQY